MKFSVTVTLKKDVLDPQGKVVSQTLKNMGMTNLTQIRQGKFFEIDLIASNTSLSQFEPGKTTIATLISIFL